MQIHGSFIRPVLPREDWSTFSKVPEYCQESTGVLPRKYWQTDCTISIHLYAMHPIQEIKSPVPLLVRGTFVLINGLASRRYIIFRKWLWKAPLRFFPQLHVSCRTAFVRDWLHLMCIDALKTD